MLVSVVLAAGLLWSAPPVNAQLVLSLDQPNQLGGPGGTVTFKGSITNDGLFSVDAANDLFLSFNGFDPGVFNPPPDQLIQFISPDVILNPGDSTPDIALFDVNLDPSTPAGLYLGDVTAGDIQGDTSNDVTFSVQVPEPGSASLLVAGLVLLLGLANRRTLTAALGRHLLRWTLAGFALLWVGSAQAAVTPVSLSTLNAVISVWDTNPTKVGVELQIGNIGTADAANVKVTSVGVQGGSFSGPGTLPITLGTIAADDDTMFDFVVTVPKTDGTAHYLLTVSGTYSYLGKAYGFSVNRSVTPNSAGPGPVTAQNGIATIQNPNLVTYPPAPTQPPFEPNAETPNFLPIGPPSQVFTPTPTGTALGGSTGGASVQIPVNTQHGTGPGVPPDPNAAAEGGGVVLATYNTSISYSTDGGQTFTDVNLFNPVPGNPSRTSFFPQSDGGLCCDQVVVYVPNQNLFFWLEQYWPITGCVKNCGTATAVQGITQPDRVRIAWATPAAIKANFYNAWTYIDLTANASPGVSSGLGAANNEWVDYPDLAWSNTFLYFMIDHGFPTPGQVYTGQRIVARLSLADITNPAATVVNYGYATITGSAGLNKDHIAQQAPGKMVFASLDNSSTLRVFTWNDNENTISNSTVAITSINQGSNYTSLAPDNTDWVKVSFPGNITGAVYRAVIPGLQQPTQDQYVFAFDAGVNAGAGRPQSYVRLENLTPSGSNWSVLEEYDIWNSNFAFAMAGLGRDDNQVSPDIGINLAVGGGTVGYPQESVGFKDDFIVFQVTSSNATQVSRFGDYLSARFIAGSDSQFAAEAYDVILNPVPPGGTATCAAVGCAAKMRYIQFGRPPVHIN